MNLIQDCILCYNEFEEGSAPCGDTQNLSEVFCKYFHSSITQKISSSHSSRDKLPLCPKCFESVVELKDLNQQLAFIQTRISEVVFIRSLEILHRRGKNNCTEDNRPKDDNLERQLLLIELDFSTLPNCDFTKVNSIVRTDIVTSEENYDVKEDTCFEELPDPLLISSTDINTVDVTFETIKVERGEVDLINNSHGINNITENVDADLCVEKSKQISGISTVNTKTKGKNPILKRQKLNYCEKTISIKERQGNFGAEDSQNMQIDGTEMALGGSFEVTDARKISSDGCFKGSFQNCVSTMNLESLSNQQISEEINPASALTSETICSSTSEFGNQNSRLIESVSQRVHCQVIGKEQQTLLKVLPDIHSKNDLSNESKNRYRRVLRSRIGHGDRGKINFKRAASKKGFSQQCDLKKHERVHSEKRLVHTGEKRFQCEFCQKSFAEKCTKERHTRIHTGEKPYMCEFCGKEFGRKSSKKRHSRIHTGELYNCEVCGKGFNEQCYLKVHKRVHTGEKPFMCEFCGKGFNERCNLKVHKRMHTGEKPFICEFCGEGFVLKTGLNRHITTHTGEKPYKCKYCGKEFTRQGVMAKHVKRTHSVGEKSKLV